MTILDERTVALGFDLGSLIGGAVDYLDNGGGLFGWFCDKSRPDAVSELQMTVHGQVIARTITFRDRPDIDRVVGHQTRAGFIFGWSAFDKAPLAALLEQNGDSEVNVVVSELGLDLQWIIPRLTLDTLRKLVAKSPNGDRKRENRRYLNAVDIWQSGAFDASWYARSQGLDGAGEAQALAHYLDVGDAAGAKPCFVFDPAFYAASAGLGGAAGALLHYVRSNNPRAATSVHFDATWFTAQGGLRPGLSALGSYLAQRRTASPNAGFDLLRYLAENPDLADVGDPYEHFVAHGLSEANGVLLTLSKAGMGKERGQGAAFSEVSIEAKPSSLMLDNRTEAYQKNPESILSAIDALAASGSVDAQALVGLTVNEPISVHGRASAPEVVASAMSEYRLQLEWGNASILAQQLTDLGLFDSDYYVDQNEAMSTAAMDPALHFATIGLCEGLNPNPYFDTVWYGKKQFKFPPKEGALRHYIETGEAQGFKPHPVLDIVWYAETYSLERGDGRALAHYLLNRRSNQVSPNGYFSVDEYLERYPDIREAGIDAFEHWYNAGVFEGRTGSNQFDGNFVWQTYLNNSKTINPFTVFMDLGTDLKWQSVRDPAVLYPSNLNNIDEKQKQIGEYIHDFASLNNDIYSAFDEITDTDILFSNAAIFLRWTQKNVDRAYALRKYNELNYDRLNKFVAEMGGIGGTVGHFLGVISNQYAQLKFDVHLKPQVSIVIPVHNKFSLTYDCLKSVQSAATKVSYEIIVVDDLSSDETLLASLVFVGGARTIRAPRNEGFVGSCNLGAALARGQYILFLNNDTLVEDGWLDALSDTLKLDPGIGIVGSRLLFADGVLQEAGGIIWADASGWNWGRGQDKNDPRYSYMRDADYVSGAALMIRAELWNELNGFDARYAPAYYEDTDLCFRVREAGKRVVMQPASTIIHLEGQSNGTSTSSGLKRYQVVNHKKFKARWSKVLAKHRPNGQEPFKEAERQVRRRALFIDDTTPTPDQDAGSNAAFEHMLSLQRLGYKVAFLPADNMAFIPGYTPALQARGIECWYAPYAWSVEEYLRKHATDIDLVYIHRKNNAVRYLQVVRKFLPAAHVVFNYADIHSLRELREAKLLGAGETRIAVMQRELDAEIALATQVDSVIVHSTYEAELLNKHQSKTKAHYVPWRFDARRSPAKLSGRQGVVFVGGFGHAPNVDAVDWFVSEIWPLVRARQTTHSFKIVGSKMPDRFRELSAPDLEPMGFVADLDALLDRTLVTVAPLRYGAGLKGKVITSFSRGVPCIMTTIAAEGMALPSELHQLVVDEPALIAERVLLFMNDRERWLAASQSAVAFVSQGFSGPVIDSKLSSAIKHATNLPMSSR
jgi:O-antigen biosynthesis protein